MGFNSAFKGLIRTHSSSVASFVMHSSVIFYVWCFVMEAYECGNEPSDSIKCGELLD